MIGEEVWITFEVLGVSRRYLRGMYPRLTSFFSYVATPLRRTPYPEWPKNRFAGYVKNGQIPLFLLFQLLWPKWCMSYGPNVSYGVKLLNRHLFVKKFFFDSPSFKKFLRLKIFENFAWKNFRPTKSGIWRCSSAPSFRPQNPII